MRRRPDGAAIVQDENLWRLVVDTCALLDSAREVAANRYVDQRDPLSELCELAVSGVTDRAIRIMEKQQDRAVRRPCELVIQRGEIGYGVEDRSSGHGSLAVVVSVHARTLCTRKL